MTRKEIEDALLTGRVVNIDSGDEGSIELAAPHGIRLAEVVFDRLRSTTVNELATDIGFFEALEAAFLDSSNEPRPNSAACSSTDKATVETDARCWRLKKVETCGFGGLNTVPGDVFEFDARGSDSCIEGQNGSGKSSLANAVLFAMTGKIHRDQYGIWDNPARLEPVLSDDGKKLGDWPPIAVYPISWGNDLPPVDVSVTLTFEDVDNGEEIFAKRRLHGTTGALKEEVSVDPRLTAVPTLVEAGLLMPIRVQHIRMPEPNDNDQLVGLIRQLIGLEPLLDVANLVDRLCHGNQRFLKYARDNDSEGKRKDFSRLLKEAQEEIEELDTGLNLIIDVEAKKPVPDDRLTGVSRAKEELARRQTKGFHALAGLAFEEFDPDEAEHRRRVAEAIDQLYLDAARQTDPKSLPLVLKGITSLANRVGSQDFEGLKSALEVGQDQLTGAVKWATRQKEDMLLRLKAVAAAHFEDHDDPLCPLCAQPISGADHRSLVEDLRNLKSDAEAAQTRLGDACRRIEREVVRAAQQLVPEIFFKVERFAVKRSIRDEIRSTFVEASHIAQSLPGFSGIAQNAFDSAFATVSEFEFGSELPEAPAEDNAKRVRRFLDHLNDTVRAAENWPQFRQEFRDGWALLFSKTEERSLTTRIVQLKGVIDSVEPYRLASKKAEQALEIVSEYNAIIWRQVLREDIAKALKPLRKLRTLINLTTRQTIDDVSDGAKQIHQKIYNPESLSYEKAEISEYRGRQSLSFQAKLGNDRQWLIDASVLANVSWMRGILWSFVFAIRERAIDRTGHCPFELMVLDDPQMTFDTRNLKGWAQFLGSSEGLRQHQNCQLLVTTHSMPFALEMTEMHDIRMLAIETGQPWSKPAQLVDGDFAGVRFDKMIAENSDSRARLLIGDIRVLCETLLKHAMERFDPLFVRQSEATLGRMIERISDLNSSGQAPYTDHVFGQLIAVKSSHPLEFSQLSEPHHSASETITVRQGKQAYKFWREKLYPAVHKVWEEYRFLQKSIVGEAAAIPLPANCNHKPPRSIALAAARPSVLGRVSAYSDGRAASAIRIDDLSSADVVDLSARAAYRLERDTLSPVARVGDILLTRLDKQCRAPNLVIEDRGTYLVARRWVEYAAAPTLAVLSASSSNPREIPPAIISRAKGANRRKIVGVLFAADRLRSGEAINSDTEAISLEADNRIVAELVAHTDVFEVQGSSAEPMALDKQYLLAKPSTHDLKIAVNELDGRPVIAEDNEDCAFFKRLRVLDSKSIILESLDKTGSEELVRLSADPEQAGPTLVRIREVVGVVFDKV